MARRVPKRVEYHDEQGRHLWEQVDQRYGNLNKFFRAVAAKTGNQPDSEKSSFYRFVRDGKPLPDDTLKVTAELLEVPASIFQRSPYRTVHLDEKTRAQLSDRLARLEPLLAETLREIRALRDQ